MIALESLNANALIYVIAAVIVGVFTWKTGSAGNWKSNYEAEKVKADDLTKENTDLRTRITHLEALPNVEVLHDKLETHDKNAVKRNEQIIKQFADVNSALAKIAKKI